MNNLTGIRGLAALWVVSAHYQSYFLMDSNLLKLLVPITSHGYFGVDLFFCLSGFILGYVYFDDMTLIGNQKANLFKSFYLKRFARLYPVYFVTTSAAALFYFIGVWSNHSFSTLESSSLSASNFLKNLLAVQAWDSSPSLNGPAWSLSAEFLAYGFFSILILIFRIRINQNFAATILFLTSLALLEASVRGIYLINGSISRVLSEFTMGFCGFILIRNLKPKKVTIMVFRILIPAILLLSLYVIDDVTILNSVIPILLFLIIVLNYFHNFPNRGLSRMIIVKLGLWSYSLYLTHGLLQMVFSALNLPNYSTNYFLDVIQVLLILTLPIFIAFATTHFIENPCRRYLLKR